MKRFLSILILLVALLVCTAAARTAEPPDHLKPQIERIKAIQRLGVAKLTQRLQYEIKKKQPNLKLIKKHREKINAILHDGKIPWEGAGVDYRNLEVGFIGLIVPTGGEILQVLGKDEMLVTLNTKHWNVNPLILRGVSTKGKADGQPISWPGWIEVTGTMQYTTVLGAVRTVLIVEPFDIELILPYVEKKNSKKKPVVVAHKPRVWTDATHNFTVEATFRGVIGGNVRLEKADGSVISIPIEKLSEEDREWIRDDLKRSSED